MTYTRQYKQGGLGILMKGGGFPAHGLAKEPPNECTVAVICKHTDRGLG